ncbi:fungal-specific transcription factor domain-containing protein [Plectosphaerella plurivora]|uniref:Fungal-specific transcription factor domain-containing protein n=1 Tax=Plectosphaerella plurivora TaxID=936078 RepID=A0A9P9AAM8_9PEZI|nr:fungal-specific transcription factor domain-containing protein [Plectosphaerella plurivora]
MQRRRLRGACLQCARKKRKCDHKQPQCSQCLKHGQTCELQTFKLSTLSKFSSRQTTAGPESPASQSPSTRSHPRPPPASQASVPAPTLVVGDVVPDMPSCSAQTGSTLPGEPSPCGDSSFLAPDDTSSGVFNGPGQLAMTIVGDDDDTVENIDDSVSMDLLAPSFDPDVLELTSNLDTIPDATELLISMRDLGNGSAVLGALPDLPFDQLYCPMPWPADMLVSSDRRFLWQYFLTVAEADFLCLDWDDVGHYYDFQHPYITTLPQMALSNDALRSAIFCFAAAQYELRHGRDDFARTRRIAGSEASRALSTQVTQGTNDAALLSMISAATLLQYFGTERHDYQSLAARLALQYLSRPKSLSEASTPFQEIPLTEFRWSIISTLCSLHQPSVSLGTELCRMIEMDEIEIKKNYSTAFQHWVSHPIYSFSPRLVNPLLRIGALLETQLLQLQDTDALPDPSWTTKVDEAEDMLLHAQDCDMNAASNSVLGSGDPAAVIALNASMYAAGAILLYARLRALPATAPFIRRQTQIVTDEVAKIPTDSRVGFALVFPLFIAGCEAVEQQMRDTIVDRLREPGGVTYIRGDLVGALKHIWEIRDLEPGLPWPNWVAQVDPCYRISCLF